MRSEPLVSAIMPTRGRQGWAADAVRMFQEQTYPHKELVVIDDMNERSFQRGLNLPNVRYFVEPRLTIGQKRNLACSRALGDVLMHFDSDDRYRADRIEHQIALLTGNDVDLVGYNIMEFEDADTGERWMYHGSRPIGVSMCYWRETWEERPFSTANVGEDSEFSEARRFFVCPADGRIIARKHFGNTSKKEPEKNLHQWRRLA